MDKLRKILLGGAVFAMLSLGLAFNIFIPQEIQSVLLWLGLISLVVSFIGTVRLM
jgi:hypothetical protein